MSINSVYNRSANANTLVLGDMISRGGNMVPINHVYSVDVYAHTTNNSVIGIVSYKFIRSVETVFNGSSVDAVLSQCHDFAESLFNREIEKKKEILESRVDSDDESDIVVEVRSGRGAHFIGKKWVGNPMSKEKIRVPSEEYDSYIAKGWVPCGPRSKL